jgi:hypothetical protein
MQSPTDLAQLEVRVVDVGAVMDPLGWLSVNGLDVPHESWVAVDPGVGSSTPVFKIWIEKSYGRTTDEEAGQTRQLFVSKSALEAGTWSAVWLREFGGGDGPLTSEERAKMEQIWMREHRHHR